MGKRKINIDELKKDNPFKVPDGYFEELPSIIQAKVAEKPEKESVWIFQPRYQLAAVAASVMLFAVYFTFLRTNNNVNDDVETLIAQIETEELVAYLEYSDITTEELIAGVDLAEMDFEGFESQDAFFDDIDIDELESIDLLESIDVSTELL